MPSFTTISDRITSQAATGVPALIPYLTAGFPTLDALVPHLRAVGAHSALVEVGVPFSDPMADGATIQDASRRAIANGATLDWILRTLENARSGLGAPVALMSYLNPLINLGLETLAARCERSGVSLLIIPDLPLEEADALRSALHARGVGLVQLVSPVTPPDRAAHLAANSDGFLYAVTVTGVTGAGVGGSTAQPADLDGYLAMLRSVSPVPVCAGFGIKSSQQVRALAGKAHGAIVGSALISAIERGEDPGVFVQSLRA